jgi:hypothetical protein
LAVLKRFEALAAEAAAAGGSVVALLGNHELFSLQVRFGPVSIFDDQVW